mmetsp:Transcript_84319/g.149030  ORF Transcript_84319/g.149030 Transcript_84319/m.149030 type:complete len:296 (+) Transcript_84319:385-1272(+)
MATPRTSGEDEQKIAGTASSRAFPKDAPTHPVMRIDATASLGSHSGPMACEPSIPKADITERWRSGKESGAGMLRGESGLTAPMVVRNTEKQPEAVQVARTQRKSSGRSNQRPVVLYMRTPRPVTAAFSHLKKRSPTPWPLSKYGAAGPTTRDAKFEESAQVTKGCRTRCAESGMSLAKEKEQTVVLASQSIPKGRCRTTGRAGEQATPRNPVAASRIQQRRTASSWETSSFPFFACTGFADVFGAAGIGATARFGTSDDATAPAVACVAPQNDVSTATVFAQTPPLYAGSLAMD